MMTCVRAPYPTGVPLPHEAQECALYTAHLPFLSQTSRCALFLILPWPFGGLVPLLITAACSCMRTHPARQTVHPSLLTAHTDLRTTRATTCLVKLLRSWFQFIFCMQSCPKAPLLMYCPCMRVSNALPLARSL